MNLKVFLAFALVFAFASAILLGYQTQDFVLIVSIGLDLRVLQDSHEIPAVGSINKANTNVTLIRWPEPASERTELSLEYDYDAVRNTPVQFLISLNLGNMEKVVAIPDLTKTGRYTGYVSSPIPTVKTGTYKLNITIWVLDYPNISDQLNRIVTIL